MSKRLYNIIFISFFMCITLFLGVGYAAVSQDLIFSSDITGTTQEEVFITDFYPADGATNSGTVNSNSFIKSLLTSDIALNSTSSSITYTVEVYNNTSKPYAYIGTKYGTDIGYDNSNIKFSLSISEGDWIIDSDTTNYSNSTSVVSANSYKKFNITFKHTGSGTSLDLYSVLNFQFVPLEKTQVVTLIYDEDTYRDCFLKTETVATFPEITFTTSTTNNNIARCNRDAVAKYTSGELTVTEVYSDYYSGKSGITVNNSDNAVKCKVYDKFTSAVNDASFESSNYTINNFLVLNNITEDKNTISAYIPANKEWNIDLNNKTINYARGDRIMYLTNASVVNIVKGGTIICDSPDTNDFASFVEIDHKNAVFTINGGTYKCNALTDIIQLKEGKAVIRNATISNYGNVFRTGLDLTEEVALSGNTSAGTNYSIHLEVINCTVSSTAANVLQNTSRQIVFGSFVNCTLTAGNTVFLFNNHGGTKENEPSRMVWDNIKIYITGGSLKGGAHELYTHGARFFYTKSVSFPNGLTTDCISAISSLGKENYFVLNYTSSTAENWYYIKDTSGNIMKASNGSYVKVGDKLEFLSKKNTGYALDLPSANYSIGQKVQIYADNNTIAQRWTFLIAKGDTGYHLATYDKPTYILFTHYGSATVDIRNVTTYDTSSNSYWRNWTGSRFSVYKQSGTGYYTIDSHELASRYNSAWTGQLSLDIKGGTMANGTVIQAYYHNDTEAQIWLINK